MAGERTVQFVGPSHYLRDRKTAVQRAVNCYMMAQEGLGEDAPLVLESAPGLSLAHDFSATTRGLFNADGRLFTVAAGSLYERLSSGAYVNRGAVSGLTGKARMVSGETQLAITNGNALDVFDLDTGSMTHVASAGWRGTGRADYADGYFIFAAPGTNQFYISAVDDATQLNPLDFSSADSLPDNIVTHIVRKRELYLFGSRSCEIWVNSGDAAFPFARLNGTPIDVGAVSVDSVCMAADSIVWVGQTNRGGPQVYALNGYQPQRISTQAVEQQLEACTDLSSVVLWNYQDAGAEFVAVNIPGSETTWVWEAATRQWHERGELVGGSWRQLRVTATAYCSGSLYAIGGTKLYTMSRRYVDLAGDALVRERTWPHLLSPSLEPVTYGGLELRCTTGSTSDARVTLELSNDGGNVFGAPLARQLGGIGNNTRRVRWGPLGTCPAGGSRVFRLRCSDAVPLTMHAAALS